METFEQWLASQKAKFVSLRWRARNGHSIHNALDASLKEAFEAGKASQVDKAVAEAIENAAQVLYVAAERADNDEIERTYCGAAEYVRRTINPEFN